MSDSSDVNHRVAPSFADSDTSISVNCLSPMRGATLSPIDLTHAWMAIATAQAGGVGLLDAVHLGPASVAAGTRNLTSCLEACPSVAGAQVGLRLTAAQVPVLRTWLDALSDRPHWIVLAAWTTQDLARVLPALVSPGREVWLEVGDGRSRHQVDGSLPFSGWAACGAECGGLSGRESAFVLAQQLSRSGRPFLVRGGIGVHSAAACAVAGAHAVVLDDTLHLLHESPLPPRWRNLIGRLGLTDTTSVGADLGLPVRVLDRPESPAGRSLKGEAARLASSASASAPADWAEAVGTRIGWADPEVSAWPVGEGIGRARMAATRYRTVARLLHAVDEAARTHVAAATRLAPLGPGAPLAAAIGITYPVVQGPMTRVSDTAAFAAAVSAGGALPLLALALMRGPDALALMTAARSRIDRPWGVGVLGFVPDDLRQEQMAVVREIRPPFALISGGRPDQAAELEALGIATFLHVPAPLLIPFLDQGARRLVFEGGECGGHVGPLHSFTLWDYVVETLIDRATPATTTPIQVLFAGGIHDDLSAAMVAALAAPLAERGLPIGVLMGTAYLFTTEAVSCGAITPTFQHQVLSSDRTVMLETGPGHVIRCADTPFTKAFAGERRTLAQAGVSGAALHTALEQLIAGRSRVASKGLERSGDRLVEVDAVRQLADGMFMLGEVAALQTATTTIAALHDRVSRGGTDRLRTLATAAAGTQITAPLRPADVAIVGASCLVPGARDVEGFWRNLLDKRHAITEVPPERWDWRLYYDPQPGARDKISSRWGGFVDPIAFDPRRFGIPPNSLHAITPPQLLALELTRRALVDAGYDEARPPDAVRERTSVVFATGNTADLEQLYMTRAALPLLMPNVSEAIKDRLPEWTEESYPGLLANVVAGRVANRFDFGGANLTVDAACASSLAALDLSVRELVDGRADLALAGGIEFEMSPQAFLGFSHTRALSPRGQATVFDRAADGIVISEGAVILVLKRLADAERDGDRVYAVIKGVAASSDGKGLSMTAPKPSGQRLALARAYAQAQIDPATLGMYEAHGTGTALGDNAEATSISTQLIEAGAAAESCAIGSVKSLIGHTRTAAGMVALLKVALSLHHRVLPPHAGVSDPLPPVSGDASPLYLLDEAKPWLQPAHPRRAAASAFGFGGTNYHVVVEEHRPMVGEVAPGATKWPCELFVIATPDATALGHTLDRLASAAERLLAMPVDGRMAPALTLRDLAYTCAIEGRAGGAHRAAIVADSAEALLRGITLARSAAAAGRGRDGVFVGVGEPAGDLALLFPGQGSQHPGMGRELATYVPAVRAAIELGAQQLCSLPLIHRMWPRSAFSDVERDQQRIQLADTAVAQPAIGLLSCGLLDLVRQLQLTPAAVAGHSYGELLALHAAGSLDRTALFALSSARGRAMADVGEDAGAMAMLAMSAGDASSYLVDEQQVVLANLNAPRQVVISGASAAVLSVAERARTDRHTVTMLPVSGAFHSPLMRPARAQLEQAIATTAFAPPGLAVYANLDGRPYPDEPAAIARRLVEHLEQPVAFVAQVEALYASGIRTFLEVGPGHVLSGLVRRILGDRPHARMALDGGMRELLEGVGALYAHGHAPDIAALFEQRAVQWVDLDRLPSVPDASRSWHLSGGRVWGPESSTPLSGIAPFLNTETRGDALVLEAPGLGPLVDAPPIPAGDRSPAAMAYREYEHTMRQFLDQQERMLARVLGVPEEPQVALPAIASSSLPPPQARLSAPLPAASSTILERLVRIVGDRTGYADDAIGVDLDLEADLGIDSIKRIEILSSLVASMPEREALQLRGGLDRMTRLRTLTAIASAATSALKAPLSAPPVRALDDGGCPRFVIRPVGADEDQRSPRELSGLHLVAGGSRVLAGHVAAELRQHGATVGEIPASDLVDQQRAEACVIALRSAHGRVNGIVHLAAMGWPATGTAAGWLGGLEATTLTLFRLLQLTAGDLVASSGVVTAATTLGGRWGRDGASPDAALAGGCHGVLRSFEQEYPEVIGQVADLDAAMSIEEQAAAIIREYLAPVDREAGYRAGHRWTPRPVAAPLGSAPRLNDMRPQAGWVVLATGGARGITAEACIALAAPGVQFVLVGRHSPDESTSLAAERRATGDALRAADAGVEMLVCDVGDDQAFAAALADVYARYGRIDAVVHGAGIIRDKRFELKSTTSFTEVCRAKLGGAFTLARHLRPDGLRWVVFFGSVSGRFGNAGQADYAAANEVLNRLAWTLHGQWPATRVVSINWGPWGQVGMASAAAIELLKARGIQPIDPVEGRRFIVDELVAGSLDDCEVVAGAGPWSD